MKIKQRKPLFWTLVMICSLALIGFGSGFALAEGDVDRDGNPIETEAEAEELGGGTVSTDDREDPVEFEESFGDNTQATWIGVHEFQEYDSSDDWRRVSISDPHIYATDGNGLFCAVVRLPSGARVTSVRYYYYDVNPGFNVRIQFWRANSQTSHTPLFNLLTGNAGGYTSTNWSPGGGGLRIQNGQGWYYVCFDLPTGGGDETRIWGVRILWQRDQGPAGGQEFGDVPPGSTFYQSINNLKRSGITTGFADNTYRPNEFVTRGQMAAFLARALGLYWAYPTY